ncbi:hypothetical protein [Anaerobacillus sp. 1_MG-2023]|uniref:hypothetical protein n=1 Tax=Anaerobacillus sp. 1_MG-2023 TaxID=3062655 RepID=UPI0026E38043|nr:hypothetical protein [Anaerobacillus sp. 1_MG-2023]MDO6654496.1 hypothetical protein [Anaerobacillus sp. 1_MG-2023]
MGKRLKVINDYSEVGKLKRADLFGIIFVAILPFFLLFGNTYIFFGVSFIGLFINWIIQKREKKLYEKDKPYLYSQYIVATFTVYFLILISSFFLVFKLQLLVNIMLVLTLYIYLFLVVALIYYFFNCLYVLELKRVFPFEGSNKSDYSPSMRELSRYIDLDTQKKYFTIVLIEISVYIVLSAFALGLFLKNLHVLNFEPLPFIGSWVENQTYLTTFNLVSLFSVTFAIYTITFPWKNRVKFKATEAKKEKDSSYF